MARTQKKGFDYFPLNVHDDDKMKFIRIKFKIAGFGVLIELYRNIYSQGFYCEWSDDIALLFSDQIKCEYDLISQIVSECLDRNIFDKELFQNYSILTSKGIQDRFPEMSSRRKAVKVNANFVIKDSLLNEALLINDNINPINANINQDNANINPVKLDSCKHGGDSSTQSKVKESKVIKEVPISSEQSPEAKNQNSKPKPKKKTLEERKNDFKKSLEPYLEIYGKDLLNDFYLYWGEHSEKGSKMMFEKKATFNLKMRLAKWAKNDKGWSKPTATNSGVQKNQYGKPASFVESLNPVRRIDPKRLEGCAN